MADKKKSEEVQAIALNEKQTVEFLKKMQSPEGRELIERLKAAKEAEKKEEKR